MLLRPRHTTVPRGANHEAAQPGLPPGLPPGAPLFFLPGGTPVHKVSAHATRQRDGRDHHHDDGTWLYVTVVMDGRLHDPKGKLKTTTVSVTRLFWYDFAKSSLVRRDESVTVLGRTVPRYTGQTPTPLSKAASADLDEAYKANLAPLWDAILTGVDSDARKLEVRTASYDKEIAKAQEEGKLSYVGTLATSQQDTLHWAEKAASDLAVLAKYRDTVVGISTQASQTAAQTAARLIDERAVLAERHQKAREAAAERKAERDRIEAAQARFDEVLGSYARTMYELLQSVEKSGLAPDLPVALRSGIKTVLAAIKTVEVT